MWALWAPCPRAPILILWVSHIISQISPQTNFYAFETEDLHACLILLFPLLPTCRLPTYNRDPRREWQTRSAEATANAGMEDESGAWARRAASALFGGE